MKLNIFDTPESLAQNFAREFTSHLRSQVGPVHVSLSGGSTPRRMFEILAEQSDQPDWSQVHFYWGDERCVPPTSPESNYGEADRLFLSPVGVPPANIHRVSGELDPQQACEQYVEELKRVPTNELGIPRFDWMLLGMGDDGHTASIFPSEMQWLESNAWCEVATHPESGQKRITMTGRVIRAAGQIRFLLTGGKKSTVLNRILQRQPGYMDYPTSHLCFGDQVQIDCDATAAAELPAEVRAQF